MKNNNSSSRNNNTNNNDNNNSHSGNFEKRPQNFRQNYNQANRERSGQRNPHHQGHHNDRSLSRDNSFNPSASFNYGTVKFAPGQSTRELPEIETKLDPSKKFAGRCRLFVGNLPHNTPQEKIRSLFEQYGEVGEVFLGEKSAFSFVKMDNKKNAETARDALDGTQFDGRTLRVRLAAHAAAIRVKHLSPQVSNELLAYAFRFFGEIERAVVIVDDKGKSIGEGIVEYAHRQSAAFAVKKCQQDCFMLTAAPRPVFVEFLYQHDEECGLPEKTMNKMIKEYEIEREVGPRFADHGTFEHNFGLKWKELDVLEKQKRDRLEQEIVESRKNLQDQIDYCKNEHDTMQLKNKLKFLEDEKQRLRQLQQQTFTETQTRENERRAQEMMMRQRGDGVFGMQQNTQDPGCSTVQEAQMRMQAGALQDLIRRQENMSDGGPSNKNDNDNQQNDQNQGSSQQNDQLTPMMIPTIGQPSSYAEATMMGVTPQNFMPVQQQNMYTAFIPQPQQMQMPVNVSGHPNVIPPTAMPGFGHQRHPNAQIRNQGPRARHFNESRPRAPYQSAHDGRPRKRGKF